MALPHAQPGQVVDIRPLSADLAETKTATLLRSPDKTPFCLA